MDIDDTFNTFYIDLEVDGLTEEQSVFIADETSNTFGPDSVYIIDTSEKLSGNSYEKLENGRSETHLSLVSSNLQPKDRNTLYSKKPNVSFNEFLQREKINDICQHGEMSDVGTEHKSMLETMWYFGELYFALSYIWNKKAITKIRTFCDFRDVIGDNYIDKRAVTVGSVAEGLYEPTSSFDIIFILKWIKVVTDIPEKMLSEVHSYISINKDHDYPGYCFLTVHSGFEYELISNCVKRKGQSFHLSSRLFKLFLMGESANSSSNSNCSLSLTYALGPCEMGNMWTFISSKNRKFITEYLKLKLMRLGVLLIPEGHPRSSARDLQWRISFDLQEKMLVRCFSYFQFITYVLLKTYLTYKLSIDTGTVSIESLSRIIKNVMFWQLDEPDRKTWTISNFFRNFISCYDKLMFFISSKNVPNFFIPDQNLLTNTDEISGLNHKLVKWKPSERDMFEVVLKLYFQPLMKGNTKIHHSFGRANLDIISLLPLLQIECLSTMRNTFLQCIVMQVISPPHNRFTHGLSSYLLAQQCQIRAQFVRCRQNINNKQMYADLRYRQFLILVGTHTDAMSGWILLGFHFLQLGWFNSCLNIVAYVEVLKKEYWLLNTGVSNYTAMDIHEYRKLLRLTRCSFMKMLKRLCKQPVLVPEASSLIPSECVFQEDINFIHIP
ncbi:Hypothetical predicted protein [Mytilus galloprovincialis]|uniref:Mab-21-like HhH/H2TH-like domain-containing protein n=1 Tax=Mytilus galloprovincialis TaxID=29158 RepID=A0A8B6ERT6_MYTGA|nr:Hypothetical predicted protein [Mytilus galloprovincialis]